MMSQPIGYFWIEWFNVKFLDFCLVEMKWLFSTSTLLVNQAFVQSVKRLDSRLAAQQQHRVSWVRQSDPLCGHSQLEVELGCDNRIMASPLWLFMHQMAFELVHNYDIVVSLLLAVDIGALLGHQPQDLINLIVIGQINQFKSRRVDLQIWH